MSCLLFTDSSVSPQLHQAIGGYVVITRDELAALEMFDSNTLCENIAEKIQFLSFQSNKSTFVEIKTAVLALQAIESQQITKIDIYTDCQNLCDLLQGRLLRLAEKNYLTKTGKVLAHAPLYQELKELAETLDLSVVKMVGHSKIKTTIEEKIFACIDKAVRSKLRAHLSSDLPQELT
jgi:ribonuclease HI